jgi:serine/threonine protein kinase
VLHKSELQQGGVQKQVRPMLLAKVLVQLTTASKFEDQEDSFAVMEVTIESHRFPEWKAAQYIAQMAAALKYLHKKHVMHRDIKPENIVESSTHGLASVVGGMDTPAKITDFDLSMNANKDILWFQGQLLQREGGLVESRCLDV